MATEAQDPPPLHALACPSRRKHSDLAVREGWFFCKSCYERRPDHDGRYQTIVDKRTDERITHEEFVERWGVVSYRGYRR